MRAPPLLLRLRLNKKRISLAFFTLLLTCIIVYRLQSTTGVNTHSEHKQNLKIVRRDWCNYVAIGHDAQRSGLGEQGKPAVLQGANVTEAMKSSIRAHGFNALLSEQISPERALPDVRHSSCRTYIYDAQLPSASIIIVYHNEQHSVLLRTLYSLHNRTPAELLHEIILVDDYSDSVHLNADFDRRVTAEFRGKLKIVHLPARAGLIRARVLGARLATGRVLVFLDAHVEATHNWLPPLLQPIVDNPQTCTTPIIDTIHFETFEYIRAAASRGGFNWQFNYVQLPLTQQEKFSLPEPHNNPVMNGGLFAIAADFFWHLGAYDEGLLIWGAEQFELSFKIWMCGGRLLEVPCSRLGHLYRDGNFRVNYSNRTDDYIAKNYKRVALVWMDEYQEALYEHVPKLTQIDAGDVSARRTLRQNLKCKSFKWYLEMIAPDFLQIYPPIEPVDYAYGALQSVAAPQLCLDSLNQPARQLVGHLRNCSPDLQRPYVSQRWHLSFRRDLRQQGNCLEVQTWTENAPVWLWPCHQQGGNQFWYYDRQTQMLVHGQSETERRCLEANVTASRAYVNFCNFSNANMKWHFGYVNQTAMDAFFRGLV